MFFRLLANAGRHTDLEGNEYGPGDFIESETDLVEDLPNKFERMPDELPTSRTPSKPKIPKPTKGKDVTDDPSPDVDPEEDQYGSLVTEKFKTADPDVVRIRYQKGKGYTVIDVSDDEAYHEEPLKKKEVEPFLAEEVYEEEED